MDEIVLIKGDSSDIYEFSSRQIDHLDDKWEGKWVVSQTLGSEPILQGNLIKNDTIYNNDSLIGEDYRKSFRIFEGKPTETIEFNDDVIEDGVLTVSGTILENTSPVPFKYAFITVKGVFVNYSREVKVQADELGEFSVDISLDNTVKIPAESFFIFQISPAESATLEEGNHSLTIEISQLNDVGEAIFRKELLQSRLKITKEGLINI